MEKEIIEGAVKVIQTVGFPIVVCLWFMFRAEKRFDAMTTVLTELSGYLKQIIAAHADTNGG